MNTYYIAGYPISDELYHHGIKGQKWGIRRYQNEDGTLTPAGRKRYGKDLGEYQHNHGIVRRLATGDYILGAKGLGDRREARLKNKIDRLKTEGKNTDKLQLKYEVQKERNVARDKYNSTASTGKLVAQQLLLGEFMADSFRSARGRGKDIGEAAVGSIIGTLTGIPITALAYDSYSTRYDLQNQKYSKR